MGEGTTASDDRLDDDADAPWRPGYDGWSLPEEQSFDDSLIESARAEGAPVEWSRDVAERAPEPWVPKRPERVRPPIEVSKASDVAEVHGRPNSSSTGDLILGAIVVGAIVVGAIVAVIVLRPTSSTVVERRAPLVPAAADEQWQRTISGPIADVGLGEELVAIAADGQVTALEVSSGEQRWSVGGLEGDIDRVAVVDGQVVVELRTPSGRAEVRSLDPLTGAEQWSSADRDGVVSVSGPDDGAVLFRRVQQQGDAILFLVDAVTGEPAGEPLRLSGVTAAGDDLAVQPDEGEIAIWSRADGTVVTNGVGAFNLRMAAPYDGRIVALDREGRIILFDDAGGRVDERPFESEAFGEFEGRPVLAGVVPGSDVGVVASGSSVGFELTDDRIEPVWNLPGRLEPPVVTTAGAFAVLVGPDGSGTIRETIVDPVDGSSLVVTDLDGKREQSPLLGHNAYVVAPTIGAAERRVEAYAYDGEQLWSQSLPADAGYVLAHGSMVVVELGLDESRVSLAR